MHKYFAISYNNGEYLNVCFNYPRNLLTIVDILKY